MKALLQEFEERLTRLIWRMTLWPVLSLDELHELLEFCSSEKKWLNDTFAVEFRPCYLENRFHLPILELQPFGLPRDDVVKMAFRIINHREARAYSLIQTPIVSRWYLEDSMPLDFQSRLDKVKREGGEACQDVRLTVLELGRAISLLAMRFSKVQEYASSPQDVLSLSDAIASSGIAGFLSASDRMNAVTKAESELRALIDASPTIDYSLWTLNDLSKKLQRGKKTVSQAPTYRKWQSQKSERKQQNK